VRSISGRLQLVEPGARRPTRRPVALPLEEVDRFVDRLPRRRDLPADAKHLGKGKTDRSVLDERIGGGRQLHRLPGQALGLTQRPLVGTHLRAKCPPRELGARIVAGRTPRGEIGPAKRLLVSTLREERLPELRRLRCEMRLLPPLLELAAALDQELLGILAGRQYQYTVGRDAGFQQPRPQNFYGPMVVMQNERSRARSASQNGKAQVDVAL